METIKRIVDLRQSGLTWWQVEEIVFPETFKEAFAAKKSRVWALAQKHKAAAEGAFTKKVIGCYTPCQTVVKLRERVVPMQGAKVPQ